MSATGLQAAVNQLARRIAALEGRAGGGEQLSPNYLTVDSQGRVGANFTGVVSAEGLTLPASLSAAPAAPPNRVVWQRASDGALVGSLETISVGGAEQTRIVAVAAPNSDTSILKLGADDTIDPESVGRSVFWTGMTIIQSNNGATGEIDIFTPSNTVVLLKETGLGAYTSQFLQLLSAQKLYLEHSTITNLSWPGGVNNVTYNYAAPNNATTAALYFTQYVDAQGNTLAYSVVRAPGLNGCQIVSTDPFGAPPNGTGYNLFVAMLHD